MKRILNWEQFCVNSTDGKSKVSRFEDLCRQLFAVTMFSEEKNKMKSFLESSSNNPGIETEPVLNKHDGKRYGFQAKFFSDSFDYRQARKSFEQAVKHYPQNLDVIRLYSNKKINKSSKSYQEIRQFLAENTIELQFIDSDEIFDEVRKNEYLAEYYFGQQNISDEWISRHNATMFSNLGKRFDRDFNIDTNASKWLSLFCKDNNAIEIINNTKSAVLEKIKSLGWRERQDYKLYLLSLYKAVKSLPDIEYKTISDAFNWNDLITQMTQNELAPILERVIEIKKILKTSDTDDHNELYAEQIRIDNVLDLTSEFILLQRYKKAADDKIMVIYGQAGIGKSHTIATEVKFLQETRRSSVLFLAGDCIDRTPVTVQLMQQYELNLSFEEFINVLEAKAEAEGSDIILFIDALNESSNFYSWKQKLPQIADLVKSCNFVKLVVSCRKDYLKEIIPPEFYDDQTVYLLQHHGLSGLSIDTVREFFKHYKIPFTVYTFEGFRIENPLFLKLYCLTYDGTEVSISALYDKLCKQINKNIMNAGPDSYKESFDPEFDIVTKFACCLAEWFLSNGKKQICDTELLTLNYWDIYDISGKTRFLKRLRSEGLLNWFHDKNDTDIYFFAYDQMNDYFWAKAFSAEWKNKNEAKRKIQEYMFKKDGLQRHLCKPSGLFNMVCEIYAEKYHEECIDLIDRCESDLETRQKLIDEYYDSLNWRKGSDIDFKTLKIDTIKPSLDAFLALLIHCSTKKDCCFNANYLHEVLKKMSISQRDSIWTVRINEYMYNNDFRDVKEMADVYIEGREIIKADTKQLELLLILFTWFLTTSNCTLRDDITLAIVEILKSNLKLCLSLLIKFESVNDPYVIQRLYAAVFAACCKCQDKPMEVYKEIAEFVYSTIFEKDEVYPDILVRDFARLIIEHFIYENPDYDGQIVIEHIRPPYKSKPLPQIKNSPYYPEPKKDQITDANWGSRKIIFSMQLEEFGWSGDFGRYIFESRLKHFDVDIVQMFNLALSIIFDELGYKDCLFSQNDKKTIGEYYPKLYPKTERIGKKYEWIAFYNILARVSDHCKMRDRFNPRPYQGPWEPNIRNFDPTLNLYSRLPHSLSPVLQVQDNIIREETLYEANLKPEDFTAWLEEESLLIRMLPEILLQSDQNGNKWIYLDASFETIHDNFEECQLSMWSMVCAYLVTENQQTELETLASKQIQIWNDYIQHRENTFYYSYNREYPWAPCFNDISQHIVSAPTFDLQEAEQPDTIDLPDHRDSDDKEIEENEITEDDLNKIKKYLSNLSTPKADAQTQPIRKSIGNIMNACVKFIKEDMENHPQWHAPCPDIIETLGIKQTTHDLTYYDKEGNIAAFDTSFICKACPGLIIRKDLIDSYLSKKNLKLIWIMLSEQQVQNPKGIGLENYKQWTGLCTYDGIKVSSNFYKICN